MKRLFIFGLGYTATRIASRLEALGWEVIATGSKGALSFDDSGTVRMALADASHVLSSVPPGGEGIDPVLEHYGEALGGKWLGYLSSTGVYGNTGGAWADESAEIGKGRRTARAEADADWLALRARVFRLPGIYGPGRSALERVKEGKARRIDLPDQVFSRVHVDDIVTGVIAALGLANPPPLGEVAAQGADGGGGLEAPPGAYNLADDLPCHQNQVIEEASRLLGRAAPPMQSLEQADLSPMARAFYAENRRVANGKAKRLLGWKPRYPTYREGLRALL